MYIITTYHSVFDQLGEEYISTDGVLDGGACNSHPSPPSCYPCENSTWANIMSFFIVLRKATTLVSDKIKPMG